MFVEDKVVIATVNCRQCRYWHSSDGYAVCTSEEEEVYKCVSGYAGYYKEEEKQC